MGKYPLLEAVVSAKGLPVKGVWTITDVAHIFGVGNRTIYGWIANQELVPRHLPGRGKFLSKDLEEFLKNRLLKGPSGNRRKK